jgi:hypothetical protein
MHQLTAAILAAMANGQVINLDIDPRERRRHNVTKCCQCGGKIGPGRDGRKCPACRAKEVSQCDR